MRKLVFNSDGDALTWLLAEYPPPGMRVEIFTDPTLKVGIHARGCYIKAKLALGADGGAIVADLKDLLLDKVPLPAAQLEQYIPAGNYGGLTLSHCDGSLRLCAPGVAFKAAGVQGGVLTVIADVD